MTAARDATGMLDAYGLDEKTAALVRLAALVALGAAPTPYRRCVDVALAAGADVDDVVDTLKAVAPCVGLARVVSAAPGLALAIGYDIDSALETLDVPRAGDAVGPSRVGDGGSDRHRRAEDPADGPGEPGGF